VCGSLAFSDAAATPTPTPTGRWITADHSAVIQIFPCGADYCGQIVGIALAHPGDPMPRDWQGQPQCGEIILETAPMTNNLTGAINWVGTLRDPRNGSLYQASIAVDADRQLRLHGYLGLPLFGQTQTWAPYAGRTLLGCRLAFVPATSARG